VRSRPWLPCAATSIQHLGHKTCPRLIEIGGRRIFVLHDRSQLAVDPAHAGFAVVVFGHSHKPLAEVQDGVLFLNPGSAGPHRFRLPISIARLWVSATRLEPEIIELPIA
jgi:predicted phosphodiesterase